MKRLILISSLFALLLSSTGAYAGCWRECVLPNPISGGCGRYVKVCDVENPTTAAMSLGADINRTKNNIISGWHRVWGFVPEGLRHALEKYPITILTAIHPETRAYFLVVSALENYAHRVISRAEQSKQVMDQTLSGQAPWKQGLLESGQDLLLFLEGKDVGMTDYNENLSPDLSKYDGAWNTFLHCMRGAQVQTEGKACYDQLRRDAMSAM